MFLWLRFHYQPFLSDVGRNQAEVATCFSVVRFRIQPPMCIEKIIGQAGEETSGGSNTWKRAGGILACKAKSLVDWARARNFALEIMGCVLASF